MYESDRLILRELRLEDAESFFLLNEDPEVLKYTGDLPFKSIESAREFLENYDHYQKYGFGRWAVILKENNSFIGWCGLKYSIEKDEVDIGFRFFQKYWNKGYASEAASFCIKIGQEKFKIKLIMGRAMKANRASIKVLQKIGLHYDRDFDFEGNDGVIYRVKFEE